MHSNVRQQSRVRWIEMSWFWFDVIVISNSRTQNAPRITHTIRALSLIAFCCGLLTVNFYLHRSESHGFLNANDSTLRRMCRIPRCSSKNDDKIQTYHGTLIMCAYFMGHTACYILGYNTHSIIVYTRSHGCPKCIKRLPCVVRVTQCKQAIHRAVTNIVHRSHLICCLISNI